MREGCRCRDDDLERRLFFLLDYLLLSPNIWIGTRESGSNQLMDLMVAFAERSWFGILNGLMGTFTHHRSTLCHVLAMLCYQGRQEAAEERDNSKG